MKANGLAGAARRISEAGGDSIGSYLGVIVVALIILAILIVWLSTAWMAFEKSLATLFGISISALSPSELPAVGHCTQPGQNEPGALKLCQPVGETTTYQLEVRRGQLDQVGDGWESTARANISETI